MLRYMRTFGVLLLAFAVTIGPVAPAFGQAQQGQAQQQTTPPAAAQAQNAPPAPAQPKKITDQAPPEYTKGKAAFPNLLGPYSPLHVAQPSFKNSDHLSQFVKDGKLSLSLQDCVALALENSIDIDVQRYAPWIADTAILSALSGAGTAYSYDPILSLSSRAATTNSPVENPLLVGLSGTGLSAITSHSVTGNISYTQGFATGTNLSITQTNTRASSAGENVFNPSVTSGMTIQVTQQLLNGFGLVPNMRGIRIARNNEKISELAFQQQVITTVTTVQGDYWNLVEAIQNISVANQAVAAAQSLYDSNKKQADIGTMAPLDVTTAKAQLATQQTALIQAQTARRQAEVVLLAAVTKDPLSAVGMNTEIVPTDSTYVPEEVEKIPLDQAVREALANRPDYKEFQAALKNDDINIRADRNALLPTLSVTGQYGWSGLAGVKTNPSTPNGTFIANTNSPIVTSTGALTGDFNAIELSTPAATPTTSTGLGNALDEIFTNQFPTYGLSVNLTVPIRNRAAQSASIGAILTQRQDQTKLQQEQNVIVVAVREAQIALEQARATLTSAIQSRELQQESYDAEVKKLNLGVATALDVVTAQNTLVSAAGAEVQARVNLVIAKVNFDSAMGRTFQVNNITLAGEKSGNPVVTREPLIPGTRADGSLVKSEPQN